MYGISGDVHVEVYKYKNIRGMSGCEEKIVKGAPKAMIIR
jgi:hypothetical protein